MSTAVDWLRVQEIKSTTGRGGKRKGAGRKKKPFGFESVRHNISLSKKASDELKFRCKLCGGIGASAYFEELLS